MPDNFPIKKRKSKRATWYCKDATKEIAWVKVDPDRRQVIYFDEAWFKRLKQMCFSDKPKHIYGREVVRVLIGEIDKLRMQLIGRNKSRDSSKEWKEFRCPNKLRQLIACLF